jgi:hypothetical protein
MLQPLSTCPVGLHRQRLGRTAQCTHLVADAVLLMIQPSGMSMQRFASSATRGMHCQVLLPLDIPGELLAGLKFIAALASCCSRQPCLLLRK